MLNIKLVFFQDEQQSQQPAYNIDSRRSSVNSSDSSNLCYSSSPSPSTPARPCAVVSNQRVSLICIEPYSFLGFI